MPVYSQNKELIVSYGSPWLNEYDLKLIADSWSKKQVRIPIDPETFGEKTFGNQPVRVGETFLVEEIEPYKKQHRLKVTDTYVQKLQSINHYDVLQEFCPNSWESEKMLASFTGSTYEREWVKKEWNKRYQNKPHFHWDANPLVIVVEFER